MFNKILTECLQMCHDLNIYVMKLVLILFNDQKRIHPK